MRSWTTQDIRRHRTSAVSNIPEVEKLQSVWKLGLAFAGSSDNLEDLRCQMTGRLALLLVVASGVAAWSMLPLEVFPIVTFVFWSMLALLGVGVRALIGTHPRLARQLIIWGLTGSLLLAMQLFPSLYVPFFALTLVFVNALLMAGSELLTAALVAGVAAWMVNGGIRAYPLPELLGMLGGGAGLAWLSVRMVYTALEWAWTTQQRASELLELARDRQAQLSRTLKSLEVTNGLLHRTQCELIYAHRQAEEARRLKERFAANISHELRTPLNLILGFSEMMYLSPEAYGEVNWTPALRQDIHQIYRSSRHLLDMIDDILDLSRFEIGGFTLEREPTPLEPLLRDTVEIVTELFRSRSIRLDVEVAPDLPALHIDSTRIRQVVLNLLNNAARFTTKGGVCVEAKRNNGEVVVSVRDTGPGIPADKLPYLFDEFYQVDHSLHRRQGGAGLGLAISKHFVEAHDGRIWVESQMGIGSTFYFALPIPEQHVPISL